MAGHTHFPQWIYYEPESNVITPKMQYGKHGMWQLGFRFIISHLNCLSHLLFDDVNVVVVKTEITNAILNEPTAPGQDVRLVRLQHFLHQTLRNLVLRAGNTLLEICLSRHLLRLVIISPSIT